MAICGCCCGCIREFGAFGFSNEKSLMYCAITPRFGWAAASSVALPPLVEFDIPVPLRLPAMRVQRLAVWLTQPIRPNKATYANGLEQAATIYSGRIRACDGCC